MRGAIFLSIFFGLLFQRCIENAQSSDHRPASSTENRTGPRRAEVLFLGHQSEHHDSGKYAPWLAISAFEKGINITYTTDLDDLNAENLSKYDGLVIYANHDSITSSQEGALKDFVENGKGLIPLHCATGCFKNSDWYIETIGGQFASHGTGTFTSNIVNQEHAVMQGLSEFETWDETYVHQRLNPDMTILMEREDDTGSGKKPEPYTWVRNQGKGRVFYTAYGHNDSTWTNPGFLQLVNNGILWAIGDQVQSQIADLQIPQVSIYDSTITQFTQRHVVPKMQEALSPEESQKLIQIPVDFDIELFAAEPDITNPIAMNWDEKGRLWIVESVDYPNTFIETDGAANDRIKICEDTDGDGKADKFTVFADSLNIPTSLVFANDGVIVSMAPYFVFLQDTDGDDKADVRKNIMSGWGKNDTHSGPSNLQYGFDNKIWGVLGFSGFDGEINGESLKFGQGIYRFAPDGSDFEHLANSSNNTWGLGFSEDNNTFISTANNTHSAFYSMPAKYMLRSLPELTAQASPQVVSSEVSAESLVEPIQKIDGHYDAHSMTPNLRQVDVVGGFTAAAGHHLYTARSFPQSYWNRVAFINEPTVRLVHNAVIEPVGAGFTEADDWNLMASSDEWFGPVDSQVGPDGAVWVADWYNFIIQHNVFVERQAPSEMVLPFTEQPHGQGNAFISPLRDINHGRIYRIVYKEAPTYQPLSLSKEDVPGLVEALKNDNMFWRMTAQRLLVETQDQSAIPGLIDLISNEDVDEIGLNSPAVHALWTLHGLGAVSKYNEDVWEAVIQALSHPAAGVRKAAASVLPRNQSSLKAIQDAGLLDDHDLNVRMNTLLALAEYPTSTDIGAQLYEASLQAENQDDAWIRKALFAAAIAHPEGFLTASGKSGVATEPAFSKRMASALRQEVYELPRRGVLPFPVDVSQKEIIIQASIAKRDDALAGVIMAQGGKQNGYALFMEKGKLTMQVNQVGNTYQAISQKRMPEKFEVVGHLDKSGKITLLIDGEEVATAQASSWFNEPLTSAIRMGYDFDNEDKIGSYDGGFRFNGNVQNASLELRSDEALLAVNNDRESSSGNSKNQASSSAPVTINIKVVPDMMKFDLESFTVKAGQEVIIELENLDGMQHNMLITQRGSLETVGAAADAMVRDPNAAQKNYVPEIPEVLFATKLLNPEEIVTLRFTAPEKPGEYPFVCTFPGHWRMMNGIMKVAGNGEESL
uniref:ThuA domain-containing protein n=1 Tax=Roseihalotalea indica TaxID=2867963 RepID=A0AA49JKN0_9BACT|nr:ThuA domain-containing protein [Tunicatimonas sp. TK19036]